jgi:hypothetical protein
MSLPDRLRRLLLPGGLVAVSLALRGLALAETHAGAATCDLRGALEDSAVALLAAAVCALAARLRRPLAILPATLWALLAYAQYEHVRALGAPLRLVDWRYLADATFFGGSVVGAGRPVVLLLAVAAAAAAALAHRERPGWAAVASLAAVGGALVAAALLVPPAGRCSAWREENPAVNLLRGGGADDSPPGTTQMPAELRADLSGTRWAGPAAGRPNVLLVLLESVSGIQLEEIAALHGSPAALPMPRLGELSRRGVLLTSFFTQQRQTQRGEYALLCGDLPKMAYVPARFTELAAGTWAPRCLPRVLAGAGYRTSYLQAAPLAFMQKDRALPATGFQEVLGTPWFRRAYGRTQWGVDDRAFLEGAIEKIGDLRATPGPWFLTLLTVGTHHPFVVPAGWRPQVATTDPRHPPFLYLDEALPAFWNALAATGVLDDTLVVITSDEALGASGEAGDHVARLSQNLGMALVSVPGTTEHRRIDAPFAQSDLALSVLDYLGIQAPPEMLGRSFFRNYDAPRPLFFANAYLQAIYALYPGGRLYACAEAREGCRAMALDRGKLLAQPRPLANAPADVALLRRVQAWSLRPAAAPPRAAGSDVPLIAEERVPIADDARYQILFSGQDITVPAGTMVEVELEVTVEGDSGWVHLRHDLTSAAGRVQLPHLPVLAPGDGVHLRYRVTAGGELRELESRASVDRLSGSGLALRFERAVLRLLPAVQQAPPGAAPTAEILDWTVQRRLAPPPVRYDLAAVSPGERHGCLAASGDGLAGRCPGGVVLSGPRFAAPHGTEVRATVAASGGPGRLRLILGSDAAGIVLLQSPVVEVVAGQQVSARLEGTVAAMLNEVQLAVLWEPAGGSAELELDNLVVAVQLP